METLLVKQNVIQIDEQQASPLSSCARLNQPVALIPAYKPEKMLCSFARALIKTGTLQAVVVVNDGSTAEYEDVFVELSTIKGGGLGGFFLVECRLCGGRAADHCHQSFTLDFDILS